MAECAQGYLKVESNGAAASDYQLGYGMKLDMNGMAGEVGVRTCSSDSGYSSYDGGDTPSSKTSQSPGSLVVKPEPQDNMVNCHLSPNSNGLSSGSSYNGDSMQEVQSPDGMQMQSLPQFPNITMTSQMQVLSDSFMDMACEGLSQQNPGTPKILNNLGTPPQSVTPQPGSQLSLGAMDLMSDFVPSPRNLGGILEECRQVHLSDLTEDRQILIDEVVAEIIKAHMTTCIYTCDLVRQGMAKYKEKNPTGTVVSILQGSLYKPCSLWS